MPTTPCMHAQPPLQFRAFFLLFSSPFQTGCRLIVPNPADVPVTERPRITNTGNGGTGGEGGGLGDEEPTRVSVQADALGRRLSPSRRKLRERASPIVYWPPFMHFR